MKLVRNIALAAVLLVVAAGDARAQFQEVGVIDFPTSATGEAQDHFLRGVAILHSFGWLQAREQFHAAQEFDPDFAMAYWGESLAYNHPLNSQMDATEPRKALERLAPTRAERLAKAPTDREKGFLNAVEILWGEGEHVERRLGYTEAMAQLYEDYPDDPEVAAFYALSMLSAVGATRDLSGRLNVRAGTIALKLSKDNNDHPGAVHYTIHSFDDPLHAPLALEAAHRFAEIAPAVSHARHMPTHIFIQHGMWNYVSGHNQYAYDAARELWQPGDPMGDATHALDWGQYGDLQLGDYEKARLWIQRIEKMASGTFLEGGPSDEGGQARPSGAVSLLKARYIVDTEEWAVLPINDESSGHELLATGLSAARTGNRAALEAAEAALDADGGGYAGVMHKQVAALLAVDRGNEAGARELMDEAVETVEAMAPPRGAASPIKPLHELYGEMLAGFGAHEDAAAMYETSLVRMPNRPRSLLGLARASVETGDFERATEAYEKLTEVWAGRDAFPGYQEAMRFLESTDSTNNRSR
jgi:tetratricopeptide (TPR) repeat protein